MSEIMKIINERERQKNEDRKKQKSGARYTKSLKTKCFCCAFKLGFVQLICEVSLVFMSSLELSIILKERELYESKHVVVECRYKKNTSCYPFWYVLQC